MTKGEALKKMQAVKAYMTSGNPIWDVTEIGEAFGMAIEALEQPEQRWIPVTERLPEPNEEDELGFIKAYLVQDGRWMDVARWDGGFWVAWGYGTALKDVTAWMPLPEPWKGEDDGQKMQKL